MEFASGLIGTRNKVRLAQIQSYEAKEVNLQAVTAVFDGKIREVDVLTGVDIATRSSDRESRYDPCCSS